MKVIIYAPTLSLQSRAFYVMQNFFYHGINEVTICNSHRRWHEDEYIVVDENFETYPAYLLPLLIPERIFVVVHFREMVDFSKPKVKRTDSTYNLMQSYVERICRGYKGALLRPREH